MTSWRDVQADPRLLTLVGCCLSALLGLPAGASAVEPGCPGSSNPDPAVLFCDDFESTGSPAQRWSNYTPDGQSFVRVAGEGVGGSAAMRATFDAGQVSAGGLILAIGRTPSNFFPSKAGGGVDHREIYWREYVRTGPGWRGLTWKLSRVTSIASAPSNWPQAMVAHLWPAAGQNSPVLNVSPARGVDANGQVVTTTYNDFPNLTFFGGYINGVTPVFQDAPSGSGWFCIEAHVRLNDPGQSNGIGEFWVDGNLEARRTDLDWVGTYQEYGINAVLFNNYWNGGSPQQNVAYRDQIVVSTQRIGCSGSGSGGGGGNGSGGGTTVPPPAPAALGKPGTPVLVIP